MNQSMQPILSQYVASGHWSPNACNLLFDSPNVTLVNQRKKPTRGDDKTIVIAISFIKVALSANVEVDLHDQATILVKKPVLKRQVSDWVIERL